MERNDRDRIAGIMDTLIKLHPDMMLKSCAKPSLTAWFVGRVYHAGQIGSPRSVVEEVVDKKLYEAWGKARCIEI